MKNELIAEAGRALYGERWQSELARALGVSERTVRHWAAGRNEPRGDVYSKIMKLCGDRMDALSYLAAQMAKHSK